MLWIVTVPRGRGGAATVCVTPRLPCRRPVTPVTSSAACRWVGGLPGAQSHTVQWCGAATGDAPTESAVQAGALCTAGQPVLTAVARSGRQELYLPREHLVWGSQTLGPPRAGCAETSDATDDQGALCEHHRRRLKWNNPRGTIALQIQISTLRPDHALDEFRSLRNPSSSRTSLQQAVPPQQHPDQAAAVSHPDSPSSRFAMPGDQERSKRRITAPRGTIRPHPGFDEEAALSQARTLRRALQRPVDTMTVIEVLTKYTLEERQYIEDLYNVSSADRGEPPLQQAVRAAFSYNVQATLLALLQWRNQYLAGSARRALSARPTDKATLIELFCGQSPAELRDLVVAYDRLHDRCLQAELRVQLGGELRELALALTALRREEAAPAGDNAARELAGRLATAGQRRDARVFIKEFSTASYPLLRRAFEMFPEINPSRADIESSIRSSFSGDIRAGLLAAAQCVSDQPAYFAERLYRAMWGPGTDDAALIRILVCRAEVDLQNVKEAYQRRYGKSLAAAVEDDTSGYYWRSLRAIIKP